MRCWAFFAVISALMSHFKVLAMVVPRNLNESVSSTYCSPIANGGIGGLPNKIKGLVLGPVHDV